jgi:hypothetical protein
MYGRGAARLSPGVVHSESKIRRQLHALHDVDIEEYRAKGYGVDEKALQLARVRQRGRLLAGNMSRVFIPCVPRG